MQHGRLGARSVAGDVGRALDDLGAGVQRLAGDCRVVGAHENPVDARRGAGRIHRTGDQGPPGDASQVLARNALRAPAGGNHSDNAHRTRPS